VDRPQTACDHIVLRFCPHFNAATASFYFHVRIQCPDVSAWFEKCGCKFFVPPTPPPPIAKSSGTVAATTAADPVDFKAMVAEKNHCIEMQCFLSGSSLQIAFRQAGAQRLVGDVSTGVFHPVVPER
jgi:hypothetical protein